jgi:hypothetical protein
LFARFLAENRLLLHPQFKAPVTLEDCAELAAELGEPDAWSVAARFAAQILPGIFRLDDPCVRLRLPPEGRDNLEQVLDAMPAEIFAGDDALGWVYQFWQKDKKDEINASERKVGGADLAPVTQLFTDNYMVRFLLENTLGAWWATRHPASPLLHEFSYLRLDENGNPVAGLFHRWPNHIAEVTVMDPCCGSGHFLVEAFSMLWQMRVEDEGLAPVDAQDAVLRDNLYGLELDPRCVQIAMFALALNAWKTSGGWRELTTPNIACSGIPVKSTADEWVALANGDSRLENALLRLHVLFREADTLGSLIDPRRVAGLEREGQAQKSLDDVPWDDVAPLFSRAIDTEGAEPAHRVLHLDAEKTAHAASLLARGYTLVATNVPYLAKSSQADVLRDYSSTFYALGATDLATTCLLRSYDLARPIGTVSLVLPQHWLYLGSYEALRRATLQSSSWNVVIRLGPGAFEGISGEVVNVCLFIAESGAPPPRHEVQALDLNTVRGASAKAAATQTAQLAAVPQEALAANPLARMSMRDRSADKFLSEYAVGRQGIKTGDDGRYRRCFWEIPSRLGGWRYFQSTVVETMPYGGLSDVILWEDGKGSLASSPGSRVVGREAWGRTGVMVSQMGNLPVSLYTGELFDTNASPLVPIDPADLPAIWQFCSSPEYSRLVREVDSSLKVTNRTLAEVPFDVGHWRGVAQDAGPLPEPSSDDPAQWLFGGRPEVSLAPLQVAVARLLGYRWPEHSESDDLDQLADADGIICLPSVAGEAPAEDRLQQVLSLAYGPTWSAGTPRQLIEQTGSKKKSLGDWLRDDFFKQHCAVFKNRPFVWHLWDGQREGFAALVNYHRLNRRTLEKLTYTYLGQDWVERQRAEVRDEIPGAEARLSAALALQQKLEAVLEGETPYDIYVRWKPKYRQPIGWDPDLNDGVRLNVRPFVQAGVLRAPVNIHWRKDRGKNLDGSERLNDVHLTLADKQDARKDVGES